MIPLAEVLGRHWPTYQQQFGPQILASQYRAVGAIMACRTSALGGQMFSCPDCRGQHFVYHSCNHRACPQCGHSDALEWLQRQQHKLLPVPYYLITFTVPAELRDWLRSHQKLGYDLLLKQSAATLQDVASQEKYLGAEVGVVNVLHTWGRQLQYHPHVHCVVPAGGLTHDGLRWRRPPSPDFFLPQAVLAARFRTRMKEALAEQAGEIPAAVWSKDWVVDVQPAGSGQTALQYLSAYVYRTALGSQRIVRDENGEITFKYKNSETGQWGLLCLSAMEFLRRLLQHVLPKGLQRVRYHGYLSPAASRRWERIKSLLDWKPPPLEPIPQPEPTCPKCGAKLIWLGNLERGPPLSYVIRLFSKRPV